jgi:hypothetical protein
MKHLEFYNKYKTSYPPIVNPLFYKGNWWRIILITLIASLVGPLILYKHQRPVSFSRDYYLRLIEYCFVTVVPFVAFLVWVNWRALTKRKRGYGWVGKFEVINKRSTFGFHFLDLAPGVNNQVKVKRGLFEKTYLGDFVLIRRDIFGVIEEISKINNVSGRLAKVRARRFPSSEEPHTTSS